MMDDNIKMYDSHILIVDDDIELCAMLREYLDNEGFEISIVHDGEAAVEEMLQAKGAKRQKYDIVILDIMLPRLNGFEVLKKIRMQSKVPVVMLTARGDDVDRIVGLEVGADDYLPKPFNPRELLARLKAVLRRARGSDECEKLIDIDNVSLNFSTREVQCSGKKVHFTAAEFKILAVLMRVPGEVVDKETLSKRALNKSLLPYDRSIDTHINNIRKKLNRIDQREKILTTRGMGYSFVRG